MKTLEGKIALWLLISVLLVAHAAASVLYVDLNSQNPAPPFSDWSTAATNIQDAIDASTNGDLILVTNGVYETGGRTVNGYALTNRVVIDKAVTVQSVNGPETTVIQGYQVPGTVNGDSAVRCVYLTNNAALIGFTLTGGATRNSYDYNTIVTERSGGGAWCENSSSMISNCIVAGNACYWFAGGVYSGTVVDCQISGNTNKNGTGGGGCGAAYSTLLNSTISRNYAQNPVAGAFSCTLSNCVIAGNAMGGVWNCVLTDCTLENNTNSSTGGGANQSTLTRCLIRNNQAQDGGGAYQCELNFCIVSNNWASLRGGGVYEIANATNRCGNNTQVIGNSAVVGGGGVYFGVSPQIVFSNWTFNGWSFVSNSVTQDGGGMYQPPPLENCAFLGNSSGRDGGGIFGGHVTNHYCTFIGNTAIRFGGGAYMSTLENCLVQGNQAGAIGGGIYGMANNCVINSNTAALNGGGICAYPIGFGLQTINNCTLTNNLAANGGGIFNAGVDSISNCVFAANAAVTNGGGSYGVNLKNCLLISNQARLGGGGYLGTYANCQFMGNLATDSGGGIYSINSPALIATNCMFMNNQAATNGGGVYGAIYMVLDHCSILGNSTGINGGGAYGLQLKNCLVTGNSAANGGGAYLGSLNNSTLVGNMATSLGGGVYFPSGGAAVGSCIIYSNSAPGNPNYFFGSFSYSCTTPLPAGPGNNTNNPAFIDFAAGNFRLQTNSPCINTGSGSPGATDLDGRPRVIGGRIDIGAYEFQGPGMGEFIGWLQQYGLPTDGSADYLDSDTDHLNNWQEWIAGTVPTNAASVLLLASPSNDVSGLTLTWQSVNNRTYYLQESTNLSASPAFYSIQSNLVGQVGTTSFTDTSATNGGPYFYRVGVQ